MSQRTVLCLVAAASAAAIAIATARAQESPADGGLQSALGALADVDSSLVVWARGEKNDSDLKRLVLESPPLATDVPPADPARGVTADAAAQGVLAAAEQRLVELVSRIHRREVELVYGTTAAPETAATNDVVEERIDARALVRAAAPTTLPLAGVPLAGMPATDERLRSEELGCDPDRLADLVVAELSEEPTATVDTIDGTIVLRATEASASRVRASLDQLAEIAARRVQVELRAWRVSRALRAEVARLSDGVALTPEAEKKLAAEGVLLGEESLVTGDGHVARTWRGDARAYVAEVAGVASGALDAVTRTLHTGFFAEVVPRLDTAARTATLSVRFAIAEPRPSGRARVLGQDVELPELDLARTATTAVVPLGRTALVGGSFDAGVEAPLGCVLAVKATLLAPPRGAPPSVESTVKRPGGERTLASLDAETKAEIERLAALLPAIERALTQVRLARERHVEVLDVRDLLVTDTEALGLPKLGIVSQFAEDDRSPVGVDADRLEGLIKRSTGGDEAWAPPAWLGLGRGAVLVRHTPSMLANVHAVVNALRRDRRGLVEIETGVYRVSATAASQITGAASRDALARLDAEVRDGRAALVAGGFVVARTGERVSVLAGRERTFLAGATSLRAANEPTTALWLARTGWRLGVRARLERGCVAAEVDASTARIRAPAGHDSGPPALELDQSTHEVLLEDGAGFGIVRARSASGVVVLVVRARSL